MAVNLDPTFEDMAEAALQELDAIDHRMFLGSEIMKIKALQAIGYALLAVAFATREGPGAQSR